MIAASSLPYRLVEQKGSAMNFQEWQRELQEWHSPRGFSDKLRAMRAEHGLNLLTAPEAGFFRDAHPAYQFAFLREATGLRVGSIRPISSWT